MTRSTQRMSRRMFTTGGLGTLAAFGFARQLLAQGAVTGKSIAADEEKANIAIVNEFCATFGRRDLDKAVSLLADNATYRPIQRSAPSAGNAKGTDPLKGFLARFPAIEFKILKSVPLGPIIVNERDDIFAASNTQPAR